mmetsp:Transcript_65348/g.156225  ORF Transcript_65348/g.156225 Transcript_65348/m.156225 type:complete len:419 (+) Transcript_65348:118-1374(+)
MEATNEQEELQEDTVPHVEEEMENTLPPGRLVERPPPEEVQEASTAERAESFETSAPPVEAAPEDPPQPPELPEGNEEPSEEAAAGHALIDKLMEDNRAFREQLAAMQAEMDAQEKAREEDLERRKRELIEERERREARDKRVREAGQIVPFRPASTAGSEIGDSHRRVVWPTRSSTNGAGVAAADAFAANGVTAVPVASTKGWTGLRQVQARSAAAATTNAGAWMPGGGQAPIAVVTKGRNGGQVRYIVQVPPGWKGQLPPGAVFRMNQYSQPGATALGNGQGQFMLPQASAAGSSAVAPITTLVKARRGTQVSYVPTPTAGGATPSYYMAGAQQASVRAPVGHAFTGSAAYPHMAPKLSNPNMVAQAPALNMSVRSAAAPVVAPPTVPYVAASSGSLLASSLQPTMAPMTVSGPSS